MKPSAPAAQSSPAASRCLVMAAGSGHLPVTGRAAPHPRPDRRRHRWRAPTTRCSTPTSSGAGAARPDLRPGPAGGLPGRSRAGDVVGHPARSSQSRSSTRASCARSSRGHRGATAWTRASPSGPRPGSIWAWRSARAASGRCCARNVSRPRATASGSRRPSSARSRSIRRMHDAAFGIGVYRYYAAIAPSYLRMLRWLLLLPGGDREEGLAQMERASRQGQLVRAEAEYQLHLVYLWYEERFRRRWRWCSGCRQRYPRNPLFRHIEATILDVYFHDTPRSLAASEALLDAAEQGEVNRAGPRRRARAPQHRGAAGSTRPARSRAPRARQRCSPANPPRRPMPSRAPARCSARGRRADLQNLARSRRQFVTWREQSRA